MLEEGGETVEGDKEDESDGDFHRYYQDGTEVFSKQLKSPIVPARVVRKKEESIN